MEKLKKLSYDELVKLKERYKRNYEITLKKLDFFEDKDLSKNEKKECKTLQKNLDRYNKYFKKIDNHLEKYDAKDENNENEEIENQNNIEEIQKEYEKLDKELSETKNPFGFKAKFMAILGTIGTVALCTTQNIWLASGAAILTIGYIIKMSKKSFKYIDLRDKVYELENKINKYKEKDSKSNKKVKENKKDSTSKITDKKKTKTATEKKEELLKAKEIITSAYGLKKDQIIQDKVNVREICNFYGTDTTNPSLSNKEKVMVKQKAA